ncbi:MAG: hypothetical protein AAFY63_21365 [Cyanobacteria bacterium J06643_13]
MNEPQINFNAELSNNEIIIRLTSEDDDLELAIKAASKLFASIEQVGIEAIRKNLEQSWQNES